MTARNRDPRCIAELPAGRTAYIGGGAGPVMVLVHGVGLNASVWTPQLEEFNADYRVVAYDTLGHGGSDRPPDGAELPDYVRQLHELLDVLDVTRAVLMGHSMGALIATLFAIKYPGRVERLIAANPVYRRPADQIAASRARADQIAERGSRVSLDEALQRWFGDSHQGRPARIEQVQRWISGADALGYARAYRAFSDADPWLEDRLNELRAASLFVTGGLDPNSTPAMASAMADAAPRGQAKILDGERHMMAYVSPRRFNEVVREFLNGASTSASIRPGRQATRA